MGERHPAEIFSPGEILLDELNARGWNQTEFAEMVGLHPILVKEIITGEQPFTNEIAKKIAVTLETSPELWMNLESSYQLFFNHKKKEGEYLKTIDKI
jgi:HTH-type transcriptional regulator / antitoxin HigA